MTPRISVIISLHNRFHLLPPVVDSILQQTLPVLEILIIDDGSTEHQPEMVERHIHERPAWRSCVRYHYQENRGQSAATNVGIEMARGDWVAFDGSDDLWLPRKLEWQFKALEKYDRCGLCFTDAWFMNNPYMKMTLFQFAGKGFRQAPKELNAEMGMLEEPVRLLVRHQAVWMQTVVARKNLVCSVGCLDPELRFSEDYDFAFRMALKTSFCYVNMPLVVIDRPPSSSRHSGFSANWNKADFRLKMGERRLEKQLSESQRLPSDVRKAILGNLRAHHSKWANWHLANQCYDQAREAIDKAVKYHVSLGVAIKWMLIHMFPRLAAQLTVRREQNDARRFYGLNW